MTALGKATDADAERLFSVLLPRFSEDEILTYLPLLMKSAGISVEPSAATRAVFDRVAKLVGAEPQDSDEALAKKLEDYYRAHPPSAALQESFAGFCRAEAGVATADLFDSLAVHGALQPPPGQHVPSPSRPVFDVLERDPSREPQ